MSTAYDVILLQFTYLLGWNFLTSRVSMLVARESAT